jgi:hypothetical protein
MTDQSKALPQIDVSVAYDAMLVFLEAYWERGDRKSDDIAVLLGGLQRLERDGVPVDQAMWNDWLEAVDHVSANVP